MNRMTQCIMCVDEFQTLRFDSILYICIRCKVLHELNKVHDFERYTYVHLSSE